MFVEGISVSQPILGRSSEYESLHPKSELQEGTSRKDTTRRLLKQETFALKDTHILDINRKKLNAKNMNYISLGYTLS